MLWCDGHEEDHIESTPRSSKKGKKSEECTTKREEKEQHVEDLAIELQELHSGLNDTQYHLWVRRIVSSIHASKDTPPQVPLITGVTPKLKQSDTFKETIWSMQLLL